MASSCRLAHKIVPYIISLYPYITYIHIYICVCIYIVYYITELKGGLKGFWDDEWTYWLSIAHGESGDSFLGPRAKELRGRLGDHGCWLPLPLRSGLCHCLFQAGLPSNQQVPLRFGPLFVPGPVLGRDLLILQEPPKPLWRRGRHSALSSGREEILRSFKGAKDKNNIENAWTHVEKGWKRYWNRLVASNSTLI